MGNIEKKMFVFKKMPLFDNFTEDDFKLLAEMTRVRKYAEKSIIIEERNDSSDFYIVAAGKIEIMKELQDGEYKRIAILSMGDFFGEMSLMDGGFTSARAQTLNNAVLLVMSQEQFQFIMKNNPDFAFKITYQIAKLLSQRLRKINEKYSFVSYAHQKALEKLK